MADYLVMHGGLVADLSSDQANYPAEYALRDKAMARLQTRQHRLGVGVPRQRVTARRSCVAAWTAGTLLDELPEFVVPRPGEAEDTQYRQRSPPRASGRSRRSST